LESKYRSHYAKELNIGMDGQEVTLAGWVHETRDIGKIVFLILRDRTGLVQITAKEGIVNKEVMEAMRLPKESVITVRGKIKTGKETKQGLEIIPTMVKNLNKLTGNFLPFEVTGKVPADIDTRLDHRHIDLRRAESNAIFKIQSTILKEFREILAAQQFEEIRTPCIVGESTEGGTELFPLVYFEKQAFLAQSPQLYKQLAVIGGMDRVMMVVPVFRAEKHNTPYHINEITQMDIEMGFADHEDVIKILKKTFTAMLSRTVKENEADFKTLGMEVPKPEVKELEYRKAISEINSAGIKMEMGEDFTREQEQKLCELHGDAIIVKNYPRKVRAFYSMPNDKDPELCNSFDLIYKGLEICSGAQRIHLPEVLIESIKMHGLKPENFDFYINAFRQGAPPHAGWSIGLERLTMKLTGAKNIRECTLFPRDRNRIKP
jgi:nondiscriminating aspartyl-tRNA synthetase